MMASDNTNSSQTLRLFVSVGTRFPMDRLLTSVERVCENRPNWEACAQIGSSDFESEFMSTQAWVSGDEFEHEVQTCDVFVSHAGMGNILLAAKYDKPIVIMPRLSSLNEHINDHQSGTADAFRNRRLVRVANSTQELEDTIQALAQSDFNDDKNHTTSDTGNQTIDTKTQLIDALKRFIDHGQT